MSDENDDAYNIDNTLKTMAEIYTSRKEYARANDIYQKIPVSYTHLDVYKRQVFGFFGCKPRNNFELVDVLFVCLVDFLLFAVDHLFLLFEVCLGVS